MSTLKEHYTKRGKGIQKLLTAAINDYEDGFTSQHVTQERLVGVYSSVGHLIDDMERHRSDLCEEQVIGTMVKRQSRYKGAK